MRTLARLAKDSLLHNWVVHLTSDGAELVNECRENLANGNVVILHGCQAPLPTPPSPGHLTAEYLEELRYDVDTEIYSVHGE